MTHANPPVAPPGASPVGPPVAADALALIMQVAAASTIDAYWLALDRLLRDALGYETFLGTYRSRCYLIGPQGPEQGPEQDPERLAAVQRLQHPYLAWQGKTGVVLIEPRLLDLQALEGTPAELQEHGWTHALLGSMWDQARLLGSFALYRKTPFEADALAVWQRLQPLCEAVLARLVQDHMKAARQDQTLAFIDELPVGILILDERLDPVYVNREGYRQALLWNHEPDQPPAGTDARLAFSVPTDLVDLCREVTNEWYHDLLTGRPTRETREPLQQVLRGALKASVTTTRPQDDPLRPPSFLIRFHGLSVRTVRDFQPSHEQLALLLPLTPAERSVALLVGQGLSNQEIAQRLHREVSTVKDHLTRVYAKLGLRSRSQLTRLLTQ